MALDYDQQLQAPEELKDYQLPDGQVSEVARGGVQQRAAGCGTHGGASRGKRALVKGEKARSPSPPTKPAPA